MVSPFGDNDFPSRWVVILVKDLGDIHEWVPHTHQIFGMLYQSVNQTFGMLYQKTIGHRNSMLDDNAFLAMFYQKTFAHRNSMLFDRAFLGINKRGKF